MSHILTTNNTNENVKLIHPKDIRQKPISILLTGSVIYCCQYIENGGILNPMDRLKDYLSSISLWLMEPNVDHVVYCDASGFLIPEELFNNNKLETLSINLQKEAMFFGKGNVEARSMEFAIENSNQLKENFFKCTGRLFIDNFSEICNSLSFKSSISMVVYPEYAQTDTRFYWINKGYYQKAIKPFIHEIRDHENPNIEEFYFRYCKNITLMPPVVMGRCGHTGQVYDKDFPNHIKEHVEKLIKIFELL